MLFMLGRSRERLFFSFRGTAVFEAYSTLTDKCTAEIDKSAKERIFYEKCPQFGKIVLYFCAKV